MKTKNLSEAEQPIAQNKIPKNYVRIQKSRKYRNFPIVVVSTSATDILSLRDFFKAFSLQSNFAFVVVPNSSNYLTNHLVAFIRKWSRILAQVAQNETYLENGHIYILPLSEGKITLESDGVLPYFVFYPECNNINLLSPFLESLAQKKGKQAIAVILSGTVPNAMGGMESVREAGGIVLVQDPNEENRVKICTNKIPNSSGEKVLELPELAYRLARCIKLKNLCTRLLSSRTDKCSDNLKQIIELVRTQSGLDLSDYKVAPIIWTIQQRLQSCKAGDFSEYKTLLKDDPNELEAFIREIPLHLAQFFRDPSVWRTLEKKIIPELVETVSSKILRVWTPSCATGEETYSLAMLIDRYYQVNKREGNFQIFATDTSAKMISKARQGIFSSSSCKTLPPEFRNYLTFCEDGAGKVKNELLREIVFARQGIHTDPPLLNVDLIACRNLLIELRPHSIVEVLGALHSSLSPEGILFVGSAELPSITQAGFKQILKPWGIYRKISTSPGGGIFAHNIQPEVQNLNERQPVSPLKSMKSSIKNDSFLHDHENLGQLNLEFIKRNTGKDY